MNYACFQKTLVIEARYFYGFAHACSFLLCLQIVETTVHIEVNSYDGDETMLGRNIILFLSIKKENSMSVFCIKKEKKH